MKLPHITIYKDKLPKGFAGYAIGPIIMIRNDKVDDKGLWLHEYEHVKQWYFTLFTHNIWYPSIRRYRAWAEARAYAVQTNPDRSNLEALAKHMAHPVYDLRMTVEECKKKIEKYLR